MKRLLRFSLVGGVGFIVDAGTLAILLHFTPLGPYVSRAIAIAFAVCATWQLNRRFTFGASRHSLIREGFRYGSVGLTSSLVNYLIYAGVVFTYPEVNPLAAMVLSSASAMLFSFFGYSRFVFRR
ncbi:GtrA family protein [Rhizobium halophytocola]|uniref:Flippase GtrA n=1 Tax=Rhizobium halophytocola TaxID=735519 RepID=A0ABS4E000_9HYPH|nr:GtrA family protein [Rhizobium halophytocola]MBP1851257.1 putative flippase GtrA [Rhizobium halophytocola]